MRADHYHPWQHLRSSWPHVTIEYVTDLPDGLLGETNGRDTIRLRRRLLQVDRRCTLAHEIIHLERGHYGHCNPTIERAVDQEAARRLIPFTRLEAAARWTLDARELATELWVRDEVITHRFDTLTGPELIALGRAAHGDQRKETPWQPAGHAP